MADSTLKEAIRIVLETSGREGIDALRKSLAEIGDVSLATAGDTGKLLDNLDGLNETAAKAARFGEMAKDLESTTQALDDASRAALQLSLQIGETEKPSREMLQTYKEVRAEVSRLQSVQQKQADEAGRVASELKAQGFDTTALANANAHLRTQIEGATAALQKQVGVVEKEAAATARHKQLLGEQDAAFRKMADAGHLSAKALQDYRARTDAAVEGTRRLSGEGGRLGGMFSGLRGLIAPVLGFLTFRTAIEGVKNLLNVGAAAESAKRSLGNLYGSQAEGNRVYAELKQLSKDNGLAFAGVLDDAKKLKAFGLDPLNGSYQALVDQNAAVGGSQEDLSGKVLALGQAWAKQKLQGEEILQLVERGVPVWDLLQKATGKNVSELQKLSQQGKLGRDTIAALYQEIGKANSGAANRGLTGLTGLLAQVNARWKDFLTKVANSGVTDYFKQQIQSLLGSTGNLDAIAQRVAQAIIGWFEAIKKTAQQIAPLVGIVGQLTGVLSSHAGAVLNVVKAWALFRLAEIAIGFSKLTLGVQATTAALLAQRSALAATGAAAAGGGGISALSALFATLGARIAAVTVGLARFIKIGGLPIAVLSTVKVLVDAYLEISKVQGGVEAASARARQYQRDQLHLGQQLQQLYKQYADTVILSGKSIEQQTLDQSKAYEFSLEGARKYFQGVIKEAVASGRAVPQQITRAMQQIDAALASVTNHIIELNDKAAAQAGVHQFVDDAVAKFDELASKGKTAAEAVQGVFNGINFNSSDGLKQTVSIIEQISSRSAEAAKAVSGEFGEALKKISIADFPALQAAADSAFGVGTEKAKQFGQALDSIRLNRLGVDLDAIKSGMTSAGREVVSAFQQFVSEVDKLGLNAQQRSTAIAQAFDNAFKQAGTQKELQALKQALVDALSAGDIGFAEFQKRVAETDAKLADLGGTGKQLGTDVAQGAEQAGAALSGLGDSARQAAADTKQAGDEASKTGEKSKEGADGVKEMSFAFAQMSQQATDAIVAQNKYVGFQDVFLKNINAVTGEWRRQSAAVGEINKQLDDQLAAFDPLTEKVKELQQQYGYVDDATLRSIAEKQQRLDQERKRVSDDAMRAQEEIQRATEAQQQATTRQQAATTAADLPSAPATAAAAPARATSTQPLATLRVELVGAETIDLKVDQNSARNLVEALRRAQAVSQRKR